jgi:hypothetical protein
MGRTNTELPKLMCVYGTRAPSPGLPWFGCSDCKVRNSRIRGRALRGERFAGLMMRNGYVQFNHNSELIWALVRCALSLPAFADF